MGYLDYEVSAQLFILFYFLLFLESDSPVVNREVRRGDGSVVYPLFLTSLHCF
jgi:hypothetical protein